MATVTSASVIAVAFLLACQASTQHDGVKQGHASEDITLRVSAESSQEQGTEGSEKNRQDHRTGAEYNRSLREGYDYVIVGGGSAGSAVANRLSANGTFTVLVLEAGGEETEDLLTPFLAPFLLNKNDRFSYVTVPQKNACLSFPGQRGVLTPGKILGGTSSINAMNYVRGSRHDFDKWETKYGAKGWKYDDVLNTFKEIEYFNVTGPSEEQRKRYHGFTGEIPINYASHNTQLSYSFLNACQEAGYSHVDYNGAVYTGCSKVQSNTAFGMRMSANACFLKPVRNKRTNLDISLKSAATKILFDHEKRATHVEFMQNGEKKSVRVGREVIVSAGAIGSPLLLMLSGIAPRADLDKHKVPVVADLPVGQGLQDHVVFIGVVVNTNEDLIGSRNLIKSFAEYHENQTGLFTIPGALEMLLFTNGSKGQSDVQDHTKASELQDYPDIEMALTVIYPNKQIQTSPYVTREIYNKYYKPMLKKNGFVATLTLLRPKSRGSVTLNSTNYEQMPLIDPNIFSVQDDLDQFVDGTLKVMKIFNTSAMTKIGATVWNGLYPSCENYTVWSPEYVKCFIKNAAFPGQHLCCTCAMGNHEDAVVDHRLRVQGGVKNVRVIDASVMPEIISGNTYASVVMIGAKGAHMILEDAIAADKAARN